MGILPSLHSYAKWFLSYTYMKMSKYIFYIYDIGPTMFNVHKVTLRYIQNSNKFHNES